MIQRGTVPNPPPCDLATDIISARSDPALCDVKLRSAVDGAVILASRFVLAARSRVFRAMLFGPFRESTAEDVLLHCDGQVLDALVGFCYTDEIPPFDGSDAGAARALTRLCAAGAYFELPALEEKARKVALRLMEEHRPITCAVLDEAGVAGVSAAEKLRRDALEMIRSNPEVALLEDNTGCQLGGGVVALSPESMSELVRDKQLRTKEITIFRALLKWAKVRESDISNEERLHLATMFTKYIRLPRIDASDLLGIVAASGLVSNELIIEALMEHAGFAEPENNLSPLLNRRFHNLLRYVQDKNLGGEESKEVDTQTRKSAENVALNIKTSHCCQIDIRDTADYQLSSDKFSDEGLCPQSFIWNFRALPVMFIDRVVVSGAGIHNANGTYIRDGSHGNNPIYTKRGEWQGSEVTFVIYRWTSTKFWYISILPNHGIIGENDELDCYKSDSSRDVPCCEWRMQRAGLNPLPSSKFIPAFQG